MSKTIQSLVAFMGDRAPPLPPLLLLVGARESHIEVLGGRVGRLVHAMSPAPLWFQRRPQPGGIRLPDALSPSEAQRYAAFRLEKRRKEWLAGRLAAKLLLAEVDGTEKLDAYEIGSDALGRPSCGGRLLSISHSNGWAMAALKPKGSSFLGADLEKTEPKTLFTIDHLGGWTSVNTKFFDPQTGIVAKVEQSLGVSTASG